MKQAEQRQRWKTLKEDIDFQIRDLNSQNVKATATSLLLKHNLVRAQGVLVKRIMAGYLHVAEKETNVYDNLACLAAIINAKLLSVGELLCSRVTLQFCKSYMKNDATTVEKNIRFTCALVNQKVIHEMAILHVLRLLMNGIDSSALKMRLVAIILTYNGKLLDETSKLAMGIVYDKLRDILYHSKSRQISDVIERLLRIKQSNFRDYPILIGALDVVDENDRVTHAIDLTGKEDDSSEDEEDEDESNGEGNSELKLMDELNFFRFDPNYETNEKKYFQHIEQLNEVVTAEPSDKEVLVTQDNNVVDMTNAQVLEHQKTVYLTMMSSMSADEAVHKLLRLRGILKSVLVDMIIRSCAQERDFTKYVGDIGDKLLGVDGKWRVIFRDKFNEFYTSGDKFEASGIRNIGKFYGHLLSTDKLSVEDVFGNVILDEEHTDSAKRVMIKFIFQQMVTEVGISGVKDRFINDTEVQDRITGLLPVVQVDWRDADRIRFLINYFTAIGLGQLTDEMRQVLDNLLPPPSDSSSEEDNDEERERRGRRHSRSSDYDSDRSFSRSRSGSRESYSRTPSRERPSVESTDRRSRYTHR